MSISISFIAGIICVIYGPYMIFQFLRIKNGSAPIKATVTGYVETRDNKMRTLYNPVVHFEINGESFDMPTDVSARKPEFDPGDEIEVYRVPNKDYVMRANGNSSLKNGLIVLGLGILLIVLNIIRMR